MTAISASTYQEFLASLLSGNKALCSHTVQTLLKAGLQTDDIYENLFKKALYEVGELWESNKISVATEHLSSLIVESIISEMYMNLKPSGNNGKKAVLGCVPGEHHQIGIKMTNDVLEKNGWNTYFLGANVPTGDLISFTKGIQPDLLGLSLSLKFNLPKLQSMIVELRRHFPDTPILIGGQAFSRGGTDLLTRYEKVYYMKNLYELEQFLNTSNNTTNYNLPYTTE